VTRRDQQPASTYFNGSGFPWPSRVAQDCFNEIEDSDRYAALIVYPKPEVLKELGLKDGNPFRLPLHRASLFAMRRLFAR
jgi:hypothetical protein